MSSCSMAASFHRDWRRHSAVATLSVFWTNKRQVVSANQTVDDDKRLFNSSTWTSRLLFVAFLEKQLGWFYFFFFFVSFDVKTSANKVETLFFLCVAFFFFPPLAVCLACRVDVIWFSIVFACTLQSRLKSQRRHKKKTRRLDTRLRRRL